MAEGQLFDPSSLNEYQFGRAKNALEGAQQFTGGRYKPPEEVGEINNRFIGHKVAGTYHRAQQEPETPNIRRSYRSLRSDVNKQYDFMTRPKEAGGMGIRHDVTMTDPYEPTAHGAASMSKDVQRGVIRTLSTASTGSHNFLTDEENDKFRAVHDVFGHAATGRGFDRTGEEAAYLSHRQMFRKGSIQALTSETRGQNSYLNYRNQGFPDQSEKLIGLPASASRIRKKKR